MLSGKLYAKLREGGKKVLRRMPTVWELARRSEEHVKGMVLPGTIFEEMGFNYIGPVDGHDLNALVATLRNLRDLKGPQFLHVITRKGKGYAPAEADPIKWHGPGPFDAKSGVIFKEKASGPTYSQVFGQWLCDMAALDPKVVGITPAMREGSGLVEFSKKFPDRYFDVAIAEQHAVTFAAGSRLRRHEARRRDLLDIPAARVRSTHPRRRAAESARHVCDRSRRTGRRRRRDAPRQLRPIVSALHSESDAHGASRRE